MNTKKDMNIAPVARGIFTLPPYDKTPPQLLGGYCPDCRKSFYPRPRFCPICLKSVAEKTLGRKGRIYSYTVVRTKPPFGFSRPYCVGYVDLDETGLRVFSLLNVEAVDELRIGSEVYLDVVPMGHDGHGEPRLRPRFSLWPGNGRRP